MASQFHIEDRHLDEMTVIIQAIYYANISKLTDIDSKLFVKVLQEIFPSLFHIISDLAVERKLNELRDIVKGEIEKKGLQIVPSFVDKVIQLYEALQRYRGVILVGPSGL